MLNSDAAGEIPTLQRAAYLTEAIAHHDLGLPPLTQTIEDLRRELDDPDGRTSTGPYDLVHFIKSLS